MEDILLDFYLIFANQDLLFDLYGRQLLTGLFVASVAVSALISAFFYVIYDHPQFQAIKHFVFFLLLNLVINWAVYFVTILMVKNKDIARSNGQGTYFDQATGISLIYSLEMGILSVLLFFSASLILKRFSTNCSTTPF